MGGFAAPKRTPHATLSAEMIASALPVRGIHRRRHDLALPPVPEDGSGWLKVGNPGRFCFLAALTGRKRGAGRHVLDPNDHVQDPNGHVQDPINDPLDPNDWVRNPNVWV